ncbi:MAG: GAF domain-containing sensor histidine kinase [Anaerolineaceae bacterium]|nr:GAF domain-containing sensor histidine kinase [Anaerolineaceae bacterium]
MSTRSTPSNLDDEAFGIEELNAASLKEQLSIYRKFIDIFQELVSTFNLDTLLRRIIQVAKDLTHSEAASILLYDDLRQELHFSATTNINKEAQLHKIIVPKESLAGWVALNRETVIVEDVHQDQRWFTDVSKTVDFPTQSIIAVPMITQNKLIGVLEALNKQEGTFNDRDKECLKLLAAQAAVAIQNTRLFQQSDLISELVHELRTPLGSINTVAYLLQRPEISQSQRIEFARTIQSEADRLNRLTSNYLDFARLESGRIYYHTSIFRIESVIDECLEIIRPKAESQQIAITSQFAGNLPEIEADRDKIRQVILNLMSNAVKYNQVNGKIHIDVQTQTGEQIIIQIQDTGIGLSEDDTTHLFERFYRSKMAMKTAYGTGLGLSICKQIIEGHGGSIVVKSEVNVGSTFIVTLPIRLE